jgi:tetrapyrrole methylase family protein/MazG family protein
MNKREMKDSYTFEELREIIADLRGEDGCPWDREQTYGSLKKCLADETEEVFEAVDKNDRENLCEELGDVLLILLLNSQIASEEGAFTFDDVITGLCRKMIRRHPHVFAGEKAATPEEALDRWKEIKRQEKAGLIR